MSLFDFPRRVLSSLSMIGGGGTRGEDDRDPDRSLWIEPVSDQDEQDADPVDETAERPEDEADEGSDDELEADEDADNNDDDDIDDEADPGDESDEDVDQGAEDESGDDDSAGNDGETDISDITAPSIGPNTTITTEKPEERLARHEQSDVDAMGLEKRREVIGGSYGPSVGRQLATYGIVLAVVGAIVAGFVLAANKLDAAPDKYEDAAPWSQADAEQVPPTEIDFPNYGHPGPGESSQPTPGETSGSSSSQNVAESQD